MQYHKYCSYFKIFIFPFVENYFRDLLEIMCLKKVLCTSMQGLAQKYNPNKYDKLCCIRFRNCKCL